MEAADKLAEEGISVEIVDPRTLRPMDTETIIKSVRKTHRVVVVEAGAGLARLGSEIAPPVPQPAVGDLAPPGARGARAEAPLPHARHLRAVHTASTGLI